MGYVKIPTRVALQDLNSAADINQLMENIEYVKALEELNYATYSLYYVQSSAPSSPAHGYLWYDTDDNKLYKYNAKTESWFEIDWQTAVKATPEWQSGKLRIGSDGILEIADGQATPNWYDCYPLSGSSYITIQDYSKKYYMYIGQTCHINSNIVPIVYCTTFTNHFRILKPTSSLVTTLRISDIDGTGYYYFHYMTSTAGHSGSSISTTSIRIAQNSNSYAITNMIIFYGGAQSTQIERHGNPDDFGVLHGACGLNISSNAYYVGKLNASGKIIIQRGGVI